MADDGFIVVGEGLPFCNIVQGTREAVNHRQDHCCSPLWVRKREHLKYVA